MFSNLKANKIENDSILGEKDVKEKDHGTQSKEGKGRRGKC